MTDTPTPSPDLLPCGRDPLDVDDRARAGRSTEHERSCPYCQGVVAAAAPAVRAAGVLADEETGTVAPDTLLPGVMRTVWSELRHGAAIPLRIDAGTGTAFIAEHAMAALVENALDDVGDLQVHTCRVTVQAQPDADARMVVEVTAAAAYVSDVLDVAERARTVVRRTVREQLGWSIDTIDIDIVDVYEPQGHRA